MKLSEDCCGVTFRDEVKLVADNDSEIFRGWSTTAHAVKDIAIEFLGIRSGKREEHKDTYRWNLDMQII